MVTFEIKTFQATRIVAVVALETVADLADKLAAIILVEGLVDRVQVLVVEAASAATVMTETRTISKSMSMTFQKEPTNRLSKTVLTSHGDQSLSKSSVVRQNSGSLSSTHRKSLIKRYKRELKSMVKNFGLNLQQKVSYY